MMNFVFIAVDNGAVKRLIVTKLQEYGISFIDVGMGLYEVDGALGGQLRVTTSTPHRGITLKNACHSETSSNRMSTHRTFKLLI